MPSYLQLDNVSLRYTSDSRAVDGVSFVLKEGELVCLLGPSGCGKTSVLRAITGFNDLDSGEIHLASKLLANTKQSLAPEERNIGMVFQDHALFPHLTVEDNIAFGLQKLKGSEKQARVNTLLELVGLSNQRKSYPHELSGGQSQRVALARALAPRPRLLLLDEPFSNLDTEMRESLGYEVRSLLKELNTTAILVTHDQHDAFALGDRVGVMRAGKLEQIATPFDLYHAPSNRFIAQFIGEGVFVKAEVISDQQVVTGFGELVGQVIRASSVDKHIELLLRPDDIELDSDSPIRGLISRKTFKGAQTLYCIDLNCGERLLALASSHEDHEIGDEVGIQVNAEHLVCF
jgi:iron(III) transport system ATP-binding protein